MEFSDILKLLSNYGVTIIVVGYFIYKDNKFSISLEKTLQELKDTVNVLKDLVEKREDE